MKMTRTAAAAAAAALLLATALTACSGGNNGNPASPGSSAPAEAVASETAPGTDPAAGNADPFGKYDPPIEVTAIRPYDENTKFLEGQSAEDNEWTRLYAERLGIDIKFAWTFQGPLDQYNQKLNVAIASNDLADIVVVNANQLKQLVEAGQVEDLTETFDRYASPYVKETMNSDGGLSLKSGTFDGKLMALPRIGSDIDEVPLLWVRTDWLQKLNLPEPKTMADVLAISDAFTNRDPDGNGKADTFGLALSKDLNGGFPGFEGFLNGYHAYYNMWLKDSSGKLVNSNIQPEMKTALAELQKLYQAKQIDKEFGTKDGNKVAESVTNGKIGMYYGLMWTPLWPLQGGKDLDPGMQWQSYPILSADDRPVKAQVPFSVNQYYVVKKGAKNPEAAVKMMNLWFDVRFDNVTQESEETYGATKDGIEVFKHAIVAGAPMTYNMDKYKAVTPVLETKDPSGLKPDVKAIYDDILRLRDGDNKGWGMERVFGPSGSFVVIENYVKQDAILRNEFYGSPTETMGEKGSTLDTLLKETFTKIIMGAAPIDEFDKFAENWKKLGGDQITQEVNEWYARQ
mgnify:CR=1 FL=1